MQNLNCMSIRNWSKNSGLCLTRTVAGELGKVATQLADKYKIPLLREVNDEGTSRNTYPQQIIAEAWDIYSNQNPYAKQLELRFL